MDFILSEGQYYIGLSRRDKNLKIRCLTFRPFDYKSETHGAAVCLADVQSSNVVGYNTTTLLPNDYTMFGVQFENVSGGGVRLGDLTGNFFGGGSAADADNILVWEDGVYTVYYYGVWNDPENPDWDNLWYDAEDADASDVTIPAGTACWYLRRSAASASLTVSGAVKVTPTTKTILANDYTMFSNPYPTAISFKDLTIASPFGGGSAADADNILVWESGVYTVYYYGVWNDPDNPDWDNLWYDAEDADASDVTIGTGLACWYLRRTNTATTLSFSSPIAD